MKYEKPVIEVIIANEDDVIRTSDTVSVGGNVDDFTDIPSTNVPSGEWGN